MSLETMTAAPANPAAVNEISGLTKTEAEEMLDWLEMNGEGSWELTAVNGTGFVLRRQ
jgi:hypothetical protein